MRYKMDGLLEILETINNIVWGPPLLIFMVAVGILYTVRLRGLQVRHLIYAHKLAFVRDDGKADGDISHFQALMTALAATIGIGSITGVATAISIGGLGALFWMWVAAFFGMATKYAEAILAIKYREVDSNGQMCGGPMYYLQKGLKAKWLGVIFSILAAVTAFGTGNMVQSNSVGAAVFETFSIDPYITGIILAALTAITLLGGISSIGKVVGILVPSMAVFYFAISICVVLINITHVPYAFAMIFKTAFTGQAAAGGFVGSSVMLAIQLGISRGVFSSEAGLGSSPIAAAAAKTDSPGRQALVSMSSVFITTGIVCTLTGLAIATTGVLGTSDSAGATLDGSGLVIAAFDSVIPFGGLLVTLIIIPFAYSTILGWAYYGEKSMEYLFGIQAIVPYRIFYILVVFLGAVLNLQMVWGIANIMNGLMAFPNLIGLLFLSGVVAKETELFEALLKKEQKKSSL
ncbi:MAG: Amino-acid carrier protein AlsT [Chlamydiia bacterium]|nr:Amino-acid carrier protein AlsT [Chlamydiia bacterium]